MQRKLHGNAGIVIKFGPFLAQPPHNYSQCEYA